MEKQKTLSEILKENEDAMKDVASAKTPDSDYNTQDDGVGSDEYPGSK